MGDRRHLLSIYLRDHYAAAGAGVALAQRVARAQEAPEDQEELVVLAKHIDQDRHALQAVLRSEGIRPNRLKSALALAAERVSRLKLNGRLRQPSPLSRVVELETLGAGIHAKRDLWLTLRNVGDADEIQRFDLLRRRAEEQLTVVERLRTVAANNAFR